MRDSHQPFLISIHLINTPIIKIKKGAYLIKLEPSMIFEMMCDLRLLLQELVFAKCNLSALGRFFANLITAWDERDWVVWIGAFEMVRKVSNLSGLRNGFRLVVDSDWSSAMVFPNSVPAKWQWFAVIRAIQLDPKRAKDEIDRTKSWQGERKRERIINKNLVSADKILRSALNELSKSQLSEFAELAKQIN